MSNIYIQEPPTSGKVALNTTFGDVDIELWSKECPKACRNFIQLCLEGYYNNLTFHRVVRHFIVQGGDPTGTGEGGQSIYGKPFKDEFHSRLRFNRRGLVGMANAGPNDNGSQFFFTLGGTPELDKKHTLFGKVVGPTVYNMVKLGDVETDENECPRHPLKILKTKVLHNPFPDIVPRDLKKDEAGEKRRVSTSKATKNFKLLSFGEEAEEDEEEVLEATKSMKGKSKSSHDLTDDPHLSRLPAVKTAKQKTKDGADANEPDEDSLSGESSGEEDMEKIKENVMKKLKKEEVKKDEEDVPISLDKDIEKSSIEELRKQARQLKREIMGSKKKDQDEEKPKEKKEKVAKNETVAEYFEMREKYDNTKKQQTKKGSSREEQTLALLAKFQAKLHKATEEASENPSEEGRDKENETREETKMEEGEEDVDVSGTAWLSHQLHFEEANKKVLDANVDDAERYEIFDPRNPINKRKRESSKHSSRDKRR